MWEKNNKKCIYEECAKKEVIPREREKKINKADVNLPEIGIHWFKEKLIIARLLFAQNNLKVSQFHLRRR